VLAGEDGLALSGRLQSALEVRYALPDLHLQRRPRYRPNDPLFAHQWHLDEIGAAAAWDLEDGTSEVRVAVIDGGVQMDHPDLVDKIVEPWDALGRDDDPSPGDEESQPAHGTAVACVAAASTDNNEGVAGACPNCAIIPIRLIHGGLTPISVDVDAFEHALDAGADVINNSWGFTEAVPAPMPLLAVLGRAEGEGRDGLGTLVVFASGNDNREVRSSEVQGQPEVLTVGATDRYGNAERYSNWGGPLDLVAPTGAVTCDLGSDYTYSFGGTSSSAPLVSGLLALALALRPELSAGELRSLAIGTARKDPRLAYDADGHHDHYGYGAVDPEALLLAVALLNREGDSDAGPEARPDGGGEHDGGGRDAAVGPGDAGESEGPDASTIDGSRGHDLSFADSGEADAALDAPPPGSAGDVDEGGGCSCRQGRQPRPTRWLGASAGRLVDLALWLIARPRWPAGW